MSAITDEPLQASTPSRTKTPRASRRKSGTRARGERFTLGTVASRFVRYPSPWILGITAIGAWSGRLALGQWGLWDALIPVMILALWPLHEWLIHVFVLHRKPRTVFGIKFDSLAARKHRQHHRDPWKEADIFVPRPYVMYGMPVLLGFWWLVTPTIPLALMGLAAYTTASLVYEWTHFIIHTPYRPKTRLYRHIWRNHRLHHCKNENYWFGVTMTLGDRIMRTQPPFKSVPTSPTCRTLGVGEDLGVDKDLHGTT